MKSQLDYLAGHALMVDLPGDELAVEDAAFLKQYDFRSICFFRRNVSSAEKTRKLVSDIKAAVGKDVLIAIDQEGGAVMRTLFMPTAPSAMALGAVGDDSLAYEVGAAIARGLASLGINWNFAPVLDLNNNPRNPVIAERSFGADPIKAAKLAAAWLSGHLSEGVATCVKHFPGHGDTHTDSHLDLPIVEKERSAIEQYELAPFRELAENTPGLMSAHIVFTALDPKLPATLSPAILNDLLRENLGYTGVTITDGMNMKAIRERWGQAQGSVMAISAGADQSLVLQFRQEMIDSRQALVDAVEANKLDIARLHEADQRVGALIEQFPSTLRDYTTEQETQDQALFASAWKRSLTLLGSAKRPTLGSKVRLVLQSDAPSDGVSEPGLSPERLVSRLSPFFPLDVIAYSRREDLDWTAIPQDGAFNIVASNTRERYSQHESQTWKPDLHLALWNPYAATDLPCPALITYGFADPALDAVVAWLKGEFEASGIFPATFDDA